MSQANPRNVPTHTSTLPRHVLFSDQMRASLEYQDKLDEDIKKANQKMRLDSLVQKMAQKTGAPVVAHSKRRDTPDTPVLDAPVLDAEAMRLTPSEVIERGHIER